MPPTNFGLIRHSLTVWNEEKRIQALQDSPLSATGQKMALDWGHKLQGQNWDRILASDLGRVRQTVDLVNRQLHLPVDFDPLLREQDWGEWCGLTFPELFERFSPEVRKQEAAGWDFRPPGGESRKEVLARGLEALRKGSKKWPGQNILIVCHEGIIKSLLYHLLDRKFLPDEPKILKGYQLHRLQIDKGQTVLVKMNDLLLSGKHV